MSGRGRGRADSPALLPAAPRLAPVLPAPTPALVPRAPRPAPVLPFSERVYALVRLIPRGHVVSYGGVAALLGHPRAARGVGGALSALPDDSDVPWWRVVNRNGEISIKGPIHGAAVQRALLLRERIVFGPGERIDWGRFGWAPAPEEIPPQLVHEPHVLHEREP